MAKRIIPSQGQIDKMKGDVTELKVTTGLLARIARFYIGQTSNKVAMDEIQGIEAEARKATKGLDTELDSIQTEYYRQDGRGKYER